MTLTKDGAIISLDNENHAEAFIGAGWTEVPSVPAANAADAEVEEKPVKKATTRKNRRSV